MKLPLPDYQKEIKVGDLSFVYKGVYHPIYWLGEDPYRPRVENLVIRNGRELFMRLYDEPAHDNPYRYRVPGGSLDNDSTKLQQAENETNEEALLKVKNVTDTGIQYYIEYPEGFLLKKGDICIAYKGTITDVFISEYAGKVKKDSIDPHDLDNDMAENGSFQYITVMAQQLRPQHIEAILGSDLVDETVKANVRRLCRGDIEAKKSYSNNFNTVIPNKKIFESVTEDNKYEKKRALYLVATYYQSPFGNTVRLVTGGHYNHAGISLNKQLNPMYSYTRRTDVKNQRFVGGFTSETFKNFNHNAKDIEIKVVGCIVSEEEYQYVRERMEYLESHIHKTTYNPGHLFLSAFGIPLDDDKIKDTNTICSIFVASVMRSIGHPVSNKPINLVKPDDLADAVKNGMPDYFDVYEGPVNQYHPNKIELSSMLESNEVAEFETVPDKNKIYHGSPVQGIKEVKAFHNDRIYPQLGPVIFASEYPSFCACYGTRWNDVAMKQYTEEDVNGNITISIAVIQKEIMKDWNKPCSMYEIENTGKFKRLPGHPFEVVCQFPCKVLSEKKFDSFWDMAKFYKIEILDYETKEVLSLLSDSSLPKRVRAKTNKERIEKAKEIHESMVLETPGTFTPGRHNTGANLSYMKKERIDEHLINVLSKQYEGLKHITLGPDYKGYIFLDKEDNLVATINVQDEGDGTFTIQNLAVSPSYKESGVLEQLIGVAVNELKANHVVILKSREDLLRAYKDKGFKIIGESKVSYTLDKRSGAAVTEIARAKIPEEDFGVPSEKKYPLDTKKRVLSAIKLFNWVDPKYEKELANNIIRKIKKFHIKDSEIHITEKNKFMKYWKGGK